MGFSEELIVGRIDLVGGIDGSREGNSEGLFEGEKDGNFVGLYDGSDDFDGEIDGFELGDEVNEGFVLGVGEGANDLLG